MCFCMWVHVCTDILVYIQAQQVRGNTTELTKLIHLSIYSFSQHIFTKYLPCSRNYSRYCKHNINETDEVPNLMELTSQWEKTGNKKINKETRKIT